MTAIVKQERTPEPPQTRAGYVFPGLGHLLVGEIVHGVGLMSLTGLVLIAAVSGLPSVVSIIATPSGLSKHGLIALVTLVVSVGLLWRTAHLRANPRELSEMEFNSNREVFLRMMRRHTTGMLGWYGALFFMLLTLLTPFLAPFDPDTIDVGPTVLAPGWWQHVGHVLGFRAEAATHGFFEYLMGTDERGRDVFSRLLYGARISLFIGFLSVSIAATIGTSIGAAAGYLGGWIDRGLMWVVDFLLAMPRLILLLAVVGIVDVGGVWRLFLIISILALTGWMTVARIVRSQVLSLKQQDFIQAARALGYSPTRIVFRHLVPNAMAPVIVYCSLAIGGTMLAEAGLSFLGLGVQPPTSTWGVLVNEGRDPLRQAPWISLFPGIAIMLAVMCFNLVGDGLRDALDPRLR
ncbi:MAG: ABC transporter permease [Myxococcales bacterium]|nr:ABC transporter permease [Myxococcales bacterium]